MKMNIYQGIKILKVIMLLISCVMLYPMAWLHSLGLLPSLPIY